MKPAPVITIDGPSGSGKSFLSKTLAKYLKWFNLESGVIYRIFACLFLKRNSTFSKKSLILLLKELNHYFIYDNNIICDFITKEFSQSDILSQKVTHMASKLATISYVRNNLLIKQRLFRRNPGLVANGRDMGTTVFPDAIIKFFLKAKLEHRVYRRMCELKQQGLQVNFKNILLQIKNRDNRDINRKDSPLKPAQGAIIIDSTSMNAIEVFKLVLHYVNKKNKNFSSL